METPGGFEEPFGSPYEDQTQDVVRAYQRRLRRVRNVLLVETLILVPLVVLLSTLLVIGRVKRGQVAQIRFGTALEVAVRDEDTATRIIAEIRARASGGKVPESGLQIDPAPVVTVVPASSVEEVLTEGEALAAIQACPRIRVDLEARILKVDGAAIAAAPSQDDVQFALDELLRKYSNAEGLVGQPKIVTQYAIESERRPPDRVKFSRDALVALFDETKTQDVYEFLGPKLSLEAVLKKHGLTKDQLQLRNRGVDLSSLHDGSKLLVKPGKDNIEVEYQVSRDDVREVPPKVKEEPDPNLEKGKQEVVSPGKPGQEKVVYRITYRNEREVGWEVSATQTTVEAEEKVVRVGTKGAPSAESEAKAKAAPAARARRPR